MKYDCLKNSLFFLCILALTFGIFAEYGTQKVHGQDDFWVHEYTKLFRPYTDCPKIGVYNLANDWWAWKQGKDSINDYSAYRKSLEFYQIDGMWYASQDDFSGVSAIVYAGWWWDVENSIDGVLSGHPSCGVYIKNPESFLIARQP